MKISIVTVAYNLPESTRRLIETSMLDSDKHDISFHLFLHGRGKDIEFTCSDLVSQYPIVFYNYMMNRGLSKSWNEGMFYAYRDGADVVIIANDDIWFTPGDVDKIAKKAIDNRDNYIISCAGNHIGNGGWQPTMGYSCFALNPISLDKVGCFDENIFPVYCLSPDTLILTADLRWIPIGDITPGINLVGVDEQVGFRKKRRYRPSTVTSTFNRKGEALRIIFEDGREVTCSEDHLWLGRSPRRVEAQHWIQARSMKKGFRIVSPLEPWKTESSYDSGWLAGIYDGEGSLHVSKKNSGTRAVTFCQNPGPVLDRTKQILLDLDIPFTGGYTLESGVEVIDINTRRYVLEFLGRIRPLRLLDEKVWKNAAIMSRNVDALAVIDRIERIGEMDLVDISTTTKTFIANGLVSHNCEDIDHHRRATLLGLVEENCNDTMVHHAGSSAINKDPLLGVQNAMTHKLNIEYFKRKWMSESLDNGYRRPFNERLFDLKIDWEDRHHPYGPDYDRKDYEELLRRMR